jgi:hypothetical protein
VPMRRLEHQPAHMQSCSDSDTSVSVGGSAGGERVRQQVHAGGWGNMNM